MMPADGQLRARRAVAAATYGLVTAGFVAILAFGVQQLLQSYDTMSEATALRDELLQRPAGSTPAGVPATARPGTSPFLLGVSPTLAGAELQKRFDALVAGVGGQVSSSQIELPAGEGAGDLKLVADCTLPQAGLQDMLYRIESGTPFLFVDQIVVQAAEGADPTDPRLLRIQISVSGQWRGGAT